MDLFGFLYDHWGLLVLLAGMAIVLGSDVHLEKRMVSCIFLTGFMICVYSVTCYIETYLGNQPDYSPLRPVLCAVNYSLVTFILVNIILIMYPMQKRYLFIPAVMNAVLCFISIPTGIVFTIKEDNHFTRGILGFLPYFINALYLVYLIYNSFHSNRAQKEDYRLLIFMYVTAVLCLIVPLFEEESNSLWFTMTIAIDVMLYYVFLLQQFCYRILLQKAHLSFICHTESGIQPDHVEMAPKDLQAEAVDGHDGSAVDQDALPYQLCVLRLLLQFLLNYYN